MIEKSFWGNYQKIVKVGGAKVSHNEDEDEDWDPVWPAAGLRAGAGDRVTVDICSNSEDQLFVLSFINFLEPINCFLSYSIMSNINFLLCCIYYLHFLRSTSVIVSRLELDSEVLCITLLSFKNFALFYALPDHLLFVILLYQKL